MEASQAKQGENSTKGEVSEEKRLEEEIAELQKTDEQSSLVDANASGVMPKRQPFNFGIKELKRVLDRMDMPKAERNRTIKMYKERLYTRVEEVKAKMQEKGLNPLENLDAGSETKEEKHATDK